jgi:hypothetical protein
MNAVTIPQAVPLTAAEIIDRLRTLYGESPPDVDQRTAAYWWGKPDDAVAWWLSMCRMVAPDPIAQSLYLAHVAEDLSRQREIKNWAYTKAAEFAGTKGSGQRRRSVVESYRLDWGHQAARDGVAFALWGDIVDVPGPSGRAVQFNCGRQAYVRVREEIERQTRDLFSGFRDDMEMCMQGRHSRYFIERWEQATGSIYTARLTGR